MNHSCLSQTSDTTNVTADPLGGHEIWEVVVIVLITGPLSLVTIIGNLLVVISFRVNRQLRTFSNYFLLSLAVADLILGAVSMNLYAVYIIMGRWTLGNLACDVWLAVDYVASNASVMNLLVISFDRFYSITRPLTYRAKRTTRRAAAAIGLAWAVSFILWGPAILFWPHVVGREAQDAGECSIPFLTEPALTFGTAIAAFYLPVTIMGILYWKIYWEIEKRAQGLEGLMGSGSSGGASQVSARRDVYSSKEEPEQTQQGASANTSPKAMIPLRDAQGRDTVGAIKPLTSRAEDSTAGPQGRQPPLRGSTSDSRRHKQPKAKRRRNTIVREKKAARTLCAILLAFILTWTPYNIMVLVSVSYCVPEKLWQLGYWLCYINSTVNPVCYALCNEHFRVTFKTLLLCRPGQRNWGMAYNANHASFRTHKTSSTV
uniref:Muscarinic acetylcholine receptor n=1 Tax=Oncorhynchus tshawytscha TaxID=74940 RepID=A0A8C8HVP7_ONCTS